MLRVHLWDLFGIGFPENNLSGHISWLMLTHTARNYLRFCENIAGQILSIRRNTLSDPFNDF